MTRGEARTQTRLQVSAGGVVYRGAGDKAVSIVLIAPREGENWRLPKGRVETGETLQQAATREVREETGLDATVVGKLRPIEYWFWWREGGERVRFRKKVYFYLMRCRGGDLSRHDDEAESVSWFPIENAGELVAYRDERAVIELARAQLLESQP